MMTAFLRTVILYVLIMLGLRLMGKRQLAELEPSELVLTMMISDLAASFTDIRIKTGNCTSFHSLKDAEPFSVYISTRSTIPPCYAVQTAGLF